jgi:hypothetical protein
MVKVQCTDGVYLDKDVDIHIFEPCNLVKEMFSNCESMPYPPLPPGPFPLAHGGHGARVRTLSHMRSITTMSARR